MKNLVVFSDIHGYKGAVNFLINKAEEFDGAIFAGDGIDVATDISYCVNSFVGVRGNCDYSSDEHFEALFTEENVKVYVTHGHLYGVKGGIERLKERAKLFNAKVVIFGHTHKAMIEESDGILFINPGSCQKYTTNRSYALLKLDNGKASAQICEMNIER